MKLRYLLLSLFFSVAMFAQNGTVTGTILDKEFNNEPLPFANIIIKGTKQGTSTDENGKYSISLKDNISKYTTWPTVNPKTATASVATPSTWGAMTYGQLKTYAEELETSQ